MFNSKSQYSFCWSIFTVRLGETSKAGIKIKQRATEGQLISEPQYFGCYDRFNHILWNYRRCEHLPVYFSESFLFFKLAKYVISGFIPEISQFSHNVRIHINIPSSHRMYTICLSSTICVNISCLTILCACVAFSPPACINWTSINAL